MAKTRQDSAPRRRYNSAMGVVEDVPELLRDLVTPEMRALAEQVKALNEKIENLRREVGEKIAKTDERVSDLKGDLKAEIRSQGDSLRIEMKNGFAYIESTFRLDERLSYLEAERREREAERRKQHPQQ